MLGIAINYLDRMALPLVKEKLTQIGIDDKAFGDIMAIQSLVYALSFIPTGMLVDRFGTRRGYSFLILWWSIAAALHAFARTKFQFATLRGFLAFGEAGAWPAGTRATAEWFPPHERSTAVGFWNAGSSIGSIIASFLILNVLLRIMDWRWMFIATASLGLLWLLAWLVIYRKPSEHPWITDSEREYIGKQVGGSEGAVEEHWDGAPAKFRELFRHRQTWAICLYRVLMDQTWWFYVTWMPGYFQEQLKVPGVGKGGLYAIPFMFAFVGGVFGGWLAAQLIKRGWSTTRARKTVICVSCAMMSVGFLIPQFNSAYTASVLIGIAVFAYTAASSNLLTIPADVAPRRFVATLNGISGLAGGICGVVMNLKVGAWIKEYKLYDQAFMAEAFVPLIAIVVILTVLGRVRPLGMAE